MKIDSYIVESSRIAGLLLSFSISYMNFALRQSGSQTRWRWTSR